MSAREQRKLIQKNVRHDIASKDIPYDLPQSGPQLLLFTTFQSCREYHEYIMNASTD
jgi:hypothetical protein